MGRLLVIILSISGVSVLAPQSRGAATSGMEVRQDVDAIFSAYARPDAPGCAVSITREGRLIYEQGYGSADLEHRVAITPATRFYAASDSKQFTAASILLLAHRGALSLDDDVRKYVPEVPDYGTPITIRHLLHHTSGLRDYLGLAGLAGWPADEPLSQRDFLAMLGRQRGLTFAPGSDHLYSNSGYALLAEVVARVSGRTLRTFAAAEIFAPLGMTSSDFRDDHTRPVPDRAIAYAPAAGGGYTADVPSFDVVGDGGLFTTVHDLALWDPADLDRRLGAPGLSARMVEAGLTTGGARVPYAGGLRLETYRGVPIVRHGGSYGGYRADVTRVPSERVGVNVLCNLSTAPAYGTGGLAQRILDVLLPDQLGPAETPSAAVATSPRPGPADNAVDPAALDGLAGVYFSEELDVRWTILVRGREVAVQRRNLIPEPLMAQSRDEFVRLPLTLRVTRAPGGRVDGFTVSSGPLRDLHFVGLGPG